MIKCVEIHDKDQQGLKGNGTHIQYGIESNRNIFAIPSISSTISQFISIYKNVVIIDTPKIPSYEIARGLWLVLREPYENRIVCYLPTETTIKTYYISYMNGIIKQRALGEKVLQ